MMNELDGNQDWLTFDRTLHEVLMAIGVPADEHQRKLMFIHYHRMVEANQRFNLTRITSVADAAIKHYADSLTLLAIPDLDTTSPLRVLDVGTGAGFPSIPLAIVCGQWRFVAIDGTGKKVRFVAGAIDALNLSNIEARHSRAVDLLRQESGKYDLILLRAVSKLAEGLKEVHGLVRRGGQVVFYKTATISIEEQAEGNRAAEEDNLVALPAVDLVLPSPDGIIQRKLIRFGRLQ